MDFNADIEDCLAALQKAELIGIPTQAGWMLAADSGSDVSMGRLWEQAGKAASTHPVILLANEQDLLYHVSALDLAVFERIERFSLPTAIWFDGILGFPDLALTESGAAAIAIIKDDFCFHLIKRFQKPLAVIPMPPGELAETAFFVAAQHTNPLARGFALENFV